jgi:hypothetical protein
MHASHDEDDDDDDDDDDGSFTISYTNGYGKEPDISHAKGHMADYHFSKSS